MAGNTYSEYHYRVLELIFARFVPTFRFIICFLFSILMGLYAHCQKDIPVSNNHFNGLPDSVIVFSDSAELQSFLQQEISRLHKNGFLEASIDSISRFDKLIHAYYHQGNPYIISGITFDSIHPDCWNDLKLNRKFSGGIPLTPDLYAAIQSSVVDWYLNQGYPFTSIHLILLKANKTGVNLHFLVQPGPLFKFDSLVVKGDLRIQNNYLTRFTGIEKGAPYSEKKLHNLDKKVRRIPFVNMVKSSELEFFDSSARGYVWLERRKANVFNGIVALVSDPASRFNLRLTGEVELRLLNQFGLGEGLQFSWKNPEPLSQKLHAFLSLPYAFKSPFGSELSLDIYKKDTSWFSLQPGLRMNYYFEGGNSLGFQLQWLNTSLISTHQLDQVPKLPPGNDSRSLLYGLNGHFEWFNDPVFPTSGGKIEVETSAGNRKILRNSHVNPEVYSNLKEVQPRYRLHLNQEYLLSVSRLFGFKFLQESGYFISRNYLEPELFRLGGTQSIRGFGEDQIMASWFARAGIEARFYFEASSALILFGDGLIYRNPINGIQDSPLSTGAGLILSSGSGAFSLFWAIPSEQGRGFSFRDGRIHIGFAASF